MDRSSDNPVTVRFALPSEELAPFLTAYSYTHVEPRADGGWVEDLLLPSWPNLFFSDLSWYVGRKEDAATIQAPVFSAAGPSNTAARFRSKGGRIWGVGLLPLGWTSLFNVPAYDYANEAADGSVGVAFARFLPLAHALSQTSGDFDEELAVIEDFMAQVTYTLPVEADAITAINMALVDTETRTVNDLAQRVDMNVRSLERVSKRAFGFTPSALLRRQRFLRSLTRFMADPSLKWLDAVDDHYYDQAHFTREFTQFMGVSPRAYAKMEKPIFTASMRARALVAGEAVQGLHEPKAGDT